MTAGPSARVAAILALLRPAAGEIVVALDDRAATDVEDALRSISDTLVRYPYAEPVDRPLPWLVAQCRHEWVLLLDDDEVPSKALVDALPDLVADPSVTHYWIAQRWVYPDASSYIDELPWSRDYQLRLLRRDPRFIRFSDEFHRPVVADGPGRYITTQLWHLDTVVLTRDQRLAKARRYERMRPGLRVAGRSMNFAFHVPELVDPRTAPIEPGERERLEAVLSAPNPEPVRGAASSVTREEIDALWPVAGPHCYRARLEVDRAPERLTVGERATVDVRVTNLGDTLWQWGSEGRPAIRLAAGWESLDGRPAASEPLRTVLPAALAPDETQAVLVHVDAPAEPGRYRLAVDLVHEHVRWFGVTATADVEVVSALAVAVVGAAFDDVLDLLEAAPDVTPLLLGGEDDAAAASGYERVPDLSGYLFGEAPSRGALLALAALRRTPRLLAGRGRFQRGGTEAVAALGRCCVLALLGTSPPTTLRGRYLLWTTLLVGRRLGLRTAARSSALPPGTFGRLCRRATDTIIDRPADIAA